ncbi:ROK family transcriptional regulator [Kineosporia babensis]|nr:ROK family transcriptional regulator [Kineosporia babensis]
MHLSRTLRAVHLSPTALSRADLSRHLGCTRATAGTLIADLERLGLVQEKATLVTGGRGRPSALLGPAADGPVVVTLGIATDAVRVAHSPITGGLNEVHTRALESQDVDVVLASARDLLTERLVRLGTRVAGVGVAIHGLVERTSGQVLSAPGLGWAGEPVDVLAGLGLQPDRRVRVGNVATLMAVAEATRGRVAAEPGQVVLVLHADVGVGGALLVDGRPVTGRRGLAGEYGHAPLGVDDLPCRCGARGCWETEMDRLAVARMAGIEASVATASAVADSVFREARTAAGDAAVRRAAVSLGRGIGVLVGIHDPDLVLLSEHAADLYDAAGDVVREAAAARSTPASFPELAPIEVTTLGEDGGLIGAAEAVFDVLLEDLSLLTSERRTGQRSPR